MNDKIKKRSNAVVACLCLVVGLALLGAGIYLLATGDDAVAGGAMVGLGALIVALFGCTMYLIVNFDKLREKAERKAEMAAEARRMARRDAFEKQHMRVGSLPSADAAADVEPSKDDDENTYNGI